LADLLAQLAAQLSVPDGDIITADDVRKWPDGKVQELVAERILQEIDPGTAVVCDQCDERCSIEPQRRTDPRTGKVVGVHLCLREEGGGRIEIDLNRLRRWRINKRKLAQMGYREGKPGSPAQQNRQGKRMMEKTQLITALLAHHRFSDDTSAGELNVIPATQTGLARMLAWRQDKVSRVLKRCFPAGFWTRYRHACQSDALRGVLTKLDEDVTTIEPVHYQPHHPTPREEHEADSYR
jgi:hypothetical protein